MVAALHANRDVAEFLGDGETRLIAAAYRDPGRHGELFVLPDGQARDLRTWAKQQLRCMFEECPSPDLTTVSRANKRDGFKHIARGGGHARESVNHRQGKAVVATWLRRTYPDSIVEVEYATDTQRPNIADVMLVLPSGQRVAFEVQYAALSVAEWRRRHESYDQQGIIDIWLWGHTRVRESRREFADGPFKLEEVQDELREAGMRVTFLNPETEQVGIATSIWQERRCLAYQREYSLVVEDLAGIRASPQRLTSHLIGPLATVSAERDADLARQLEELELARVERERRRAATAAAEQAREAEIAERLKRDMDGMGRRPAEEDARRSARFAAALEAKRAPKRRSVPIDPALAAATGLCRECGVRLDPIYLARGIHNWPCVERERRRTELPGLI